RPPRSRCPRDASDSRSGAVGGVWLCAVGSACGLTPNRAGSARPARDLHDRAAGVGPSGAAVDILADAARAAGALRCTGARRSPVNPALRSASWRNEVSVSELVPQILFVKRFIVRASQSLASSERLQHGEV